MRIHRLTIEGIGPFAGRHEIDFDALSVSGLFLLTGPTGSGKSTILDAIEFAIYGAADMDKYRLPSKHRDQSVTPSVELVFSTSSGIYKVHRIPPHDRPKKRGSGTRPIGTSVNVLRFATENDLTNPDAGEPVTANVQEAGQILSQVVGLDRDQFTQTVILPQGKFATFLVSTSEERRKILQDVFGTRIFEMTADKIAEMARSAREQEKNLVRDVAEAARTLWRSSDRELPPAVAEDSVQALEDPSHVTELRDLVASEVTAAERVYEAAEKEEADARTSVSAAEKLAELLKARASALATKANLDERAEEQIARKNRLATALRAANIAPALQSAQESAAAAERHAIALQSGRVAAEGEHPTLEGMLATDDDLSRAKDKASTEISRLQDSLPKEEELSAVRAKREEDSHVAAQQSAKLTELERILSEIPLAAAKLEEERKACAPLADGLADRKVALENAQQREQVARELVAAQQDVEKAAEALPAALRKAEDAATKHHDTRLKWLAGIGGELAATLEAGQPCPVCGSTEHPSPTHSPEGAPTREDVETLLDESRHAELALAEVKKNLDLASARVADKLTSLGDHDPEAVARELEEARVALAESASAVTRIADIDKERDELAAKERTHKDAHTEAALAHQRAAQAVADADKLISSLEEAVAKVRGSYPSITDALQHARERMRSIDTVIELARNERDSRLKATSEASLLDTQLESAGFSDQAAAEAALLSEREVELLEQEITSYADQLAAALATLAEDDIRKLTGTEDPQLDQKKSASEAATLAAKAALQELTSAKNRANAVENGLKELHEVRDRLAEHIVDAGPVLEMGKLVSGDNARSTTLSSYVLLRRFDDMLSAANQRLATMSDGRYELVRTEEREKGQRARKQGLALDVYDSHIDENRAPKSLSGGETFYTSLSLALGLADVVREEAGGVEIGTLFVDEGFGTLDDATRDAVMDVLTSLSEDGRSVGVVSHVAELRRQIAERIEVKRRGTKGSTLTVQA